MTVFWKKFTNSYEVNQLGEIRSVDRYVIRSDSLTPVFYKGRIIVQSIDKYGYKQVRLTENNKKFSLRVHRVVALAFVENPNIDEFNQVNHKDGNKTNNNFTNLEWCNNSINIKHAVDTGLITIRKAKDAARYEGEVSAWDSSGNLIAKMNGNIEMKNKGFDFRLVSACLLGKRKTHKGCTFTKIFN